MEGLSSKENGLCVAAEGMIDTRPLDEASHSVPKCVLLEQCSTANIEMAASDEKELDAEVKDFVTTLKPTEHSYFMMKSHGLVVGKYDTLLDCFIEPTDPLLNGYIVRSMHISTVKNATFKCRQIAQKLGLIDINNLEVFKRYRFAVTYLMKKNKDLRRRTTANWYKLVELFKTPFTFNSFGRVISTVTSALSTEESHNTNNSHLELVEVEVNTSGLEISSTQEDDTSVDGETIINTSPLCVPGFFKSSVNPSFSSADKQIDEKSKRSIRAKHRLWLKTNSCSRCHLSNQALLKSKNRIRDLRKICRSQLSPKIESMQQIISNKSMEIEKLKLKIKTLETKKLKSESKSDLTLSSLDKEKGEQPTTSTQEELRVLKIMHTALQNKMQLFNEINEKNLLAFVNKLKSNNIEIEKLKAENEKLVEEKNTLNDKLSTELILPFDCIHSIE
ncbi:uncharacterized protein LOC131953289 [Physella acuta]|uniref:uncharacterized protein LOC131953289 n=1 Tax=Physella acuta TaxID=109671 RepID=UPI0027DC943A|nr:uncharacterized protein LOC131953289 [Physella acuta]XP_059172397.1 uncharacterized protein LOC131953289 [Physella acuta]XP_059172398.1 uncharacterized protein LOC131953289 [Physella acuta]